MISGIELIRRIKEAGLSEEDINKRISEKMEALAGLISKDGALSIIANELKIGLYDPNKRVKVNELVSGCIGILAGKIVRMNGVREFRTESDGKINEGKVGSFDIGDETGVVRVVLWHAKTAELEKIKEGDVVKIKDFYVKERNFKEVHLRAMGVIEQCDEPINVFAQRQSARKNISELEEGDRVNLYGVIVHIFEPRFFEACAECGNKVVFESDKWRCMEHGYVGAKQVPFVTFFIDDGTGNTRVVCFRETVNNLFGLNGEEILAFKDDLSKFDGVRGNILGKQVMVNGRVVMNKMFNRLEFIANDVSEAKPEELISELEKTGD